MTAMQSPSTTRTAISSLSSSSSVVVVPVASSLEDVLLQQSSSHISNDNIIVHNDTTTTTHTKKNDHHSQQLSSYIISSTGDGSMMSSGATADEDKSKSFASSCGHSNTINDDNRSSSSSGSSSSMSVLKNCIGNNTRLLYTNAINDTIDLLCRDLQSKSDGDYDNIHLTDQLDVGPVSSWIDLDNNIDNRRSNGNYDVPTTTVSSSSSSSSSRGYDLNSIRTIKVPRKRYYLTNIEYSSLLLNRKQKGVCRDGRHNDDGDGDNGVSTTIDDSDEDVKEVIENLSKMIQKIKSTYKNKIAGGNNKNNNNNDIDYKDGITSINNMNNNDNDNDNDDKSNMLLLVTSQSTIEPVLELLKKKRLCLKNSMSTMIWSAAKELQLKELRKHNLAYLHATVI
jgi:hypothetical protein